MWTPPPHGGFAAEPLTVYDTVEDLIRRSHLVVIGTVEESVVAEVDDEGIRGNKHPTITVETTVAVEETLKGRPTGEVVVPTDELGFVGADEDWRVAGHRVLLFVDPRRERPEPIYVLAGLNYYQTTYLLDGEDIQVGAVHDVTGLSERVAGMTVPELRELVERVSG